MADTNFSSNRLITQQWAQDVNNLTYRGVIFAKNSTYAPVGNGVTDDYTAINALLVAAAAQGAEVVLDKNATYALGSALAIPSGTRLRTNGASFVDLNGTASNTVFITIADDVYIDRLAITIPTGKRRDRVVHNTGSRFKIDWIKVASVDQQANISDTADVAVKFLNGTDWKVGMIEISNYDRPLVIEGCSRWDVGGFSISSYVRAAYLVDNKQWSVGRSYIRGASVNTSTAAGSNGLLLASTSDYAQCDGRLTGVVIEDAGEHAVRCAGDFSHKSIFFVQCVVRKCGRSGFKTLGTDTGAPSQYNEDIHYIDCVVEDAGDSAGAAENCVAFMMEFVKFGSIVNCVARAVTKTYSCSYGVRLNGCEDCTISSPMISKAHYDAVLFHAEQGDLTRITLDGGEGNDCGRNGVSIFVAAGMTARRVRITSFTADTMVNYGFVVNKNVTGTMVDCSAEIYCYNCTSGSVDNAETSVTLHGFGLAGGGTPGWTASDGSMWHVPGDKVYKRATGAWSAV